MDNSPLGPTTPAPGADTYTSRPVTIEAVQWDGTAEQAHRIIEWIESVNGRGAACYGEGSPDTKVYDTVMKHPQHIFVGTLEGTMKALPGYWVIKGTEGEFYPCKDSVFQRKYRSATPAPTGDSSFQLSRHPYAENSFILDHFTGALMVSREDLEEAYRQLDAFLYPNPGYEPRIAEATRG